MPKQNLPSLCAKIAYISSAFLLLASLFSPIVLAQDKADSPAVFATKGGKTPVPAGKTIPMQTVITVKDNVSVEAGLLPYKPAVNLFGREVAKNYAVIQLIISNRSTEDALELHSVFFDYSEWALSGIGESSTREPVLNPWNAGTRAGEIASIESRSIRTEMLNAAPFSVRNLVVNGLVLVGTAAGGYTFLMTTDFAKGVAAFNNPFSPAVGKFWPDQGPGQRDFVSDNGFQTNKVIPKQSSDVIYAFFPIDRFLTPGLKALFLKSPAAFFNPAEMYFDASNAKLFEPFKKAVSLTLGGSLTPDQVVQALASPCHLSLETKSAPAKQEGCEKELDATTTLKVKSFMENLSLNSTHILISGIMTENVDTIPAFISGVTIDPKARPEEFWVVKPAPAAKAGEKPAPAPALNAAIDGKYLTNGTPTITDIAPPPAAAGKAAASAKLSDYLDASSIKVVSDGSSDTKLNFSFELKESIPPGSTLTFMVSKKDASGKATDSMKFPYKVTYTAATSAEMKITAVEASDGTETDVLTKPGKGLKGTVTGTGLKGASLTLGKVMDAGKDTSSSITEVKADPGQEDDTKLTFTFNLVNKIPAGSTVSFTASSIGAEKQQATGEFTVKSATAKP